MDRNKNLDIVRGGAVLIVVIYHVYAVFVGHGYAIGISNSVVASLIAFGGEIGVTLFFIMSGYGIYYSLDNTYILSGKINYFQYMKKRFLRIAPQYYVSIVVMLLVTENAVLISKEGIKSILSHLTFTHNLWADTHGTINGVLWTMGVIVQFYLVSILLYKCVKKNCVITYVISIAVVISMKYLIFHCIGSQNYFVYGRQLITSIDNFVLGMVLAKLIKNGKVHADKYKSCIFSFLSICLIFFYVWYSNTKIIYADSKIGYCWHSGMCLLLGFFILSFSMIKFNHKNLIYKFIMFVSNNEYGIYIWHLVIIVTLFDRSPIINIIASKSYVGITLILVAISIFVGFASTRLIDEKRKFEL